MEEPEKLRVFVAIELKDAAKKSLISLQESLKKATCDVRWVDPGLTHITLKFLGDVMEKDVPGIISVLQEEAGRIEPFAITIRGIGVFPDWRNPKVLWAGIREGEKSVSLAAKSVQSILSKIGFVEDKKRFVPHITIGRIRSYKNTSSLRKAILAEDDFLAETSAESMTLFRSVLSPEGADHISLAEFPFRGRYRAPKNNP